jgi:hypothetical protein
MIVKYEKLTTEKDVLGESVTAYKAVDKVEATHEHICYHNEEHPKACVRRELK